MKLIDLFMFISEEEEREEDEGKRNETEEEKRKEKEMKKKRKNQNNNPVGGCWFVLLVFFCSFRRLGDMAAFPAPDAILNVQIQRNLADKLYEKRKQGALEVEAMVKEWFLSFFFYSFFFYV